MSSILDIDTIDKRISALETTPPRYDIVEDLATFTSQKRDNSTTYNRPIKRYCFDISDFYMSSGILLFNVKLSLSSNLIMDGYQFLKSYEPITGGTDHKFRIACLDFGQTSVDSGLSVLHFNINGHDFEYNFRMNGENPCCIGEITLDDLLGAERKKITYQGQDISIVRFYLTDESTTSQNWHSRFTLEVAF